MMANKRPAEQWYTGDWYRAVDVQKCCPATRGIWRDAIDAMVNEQITGKIRGTREEIAQLLRCNQKELQRFFDDNKFHKFANVTFRNGKVTIICRRLYRAYLERESTRRRVKAYRKRQSNADVTPYSSTSSSSSSYKYIESDVTLAEFLLELICKHTPDYKPQPSIEKWAEDVRKLRELDGNTPDEIKAVFQHAQADDFWYDKVLSPASFRRKSKSDGVTKFQRIKMQMSRTKKEKEVPRLCFVDKQPAKNPIIRNGKTMFICDKCASFLRGAPVPKSFQGKSILKKF